MLKERIVFLDYLRVIACFMVMMVHSAEPFYIGGEGTLIQSHSDLLWVTFVDSAFRASVPLFVIASSYLLFPVQGDTRKFFKRRFSRVLIPFFIWAILYAVIPLAGCSEGFKAGANLLGTTLNFPQTAGHLWFVPMLLGVYILMPMLSPWIEKLSAKGERIFLAIWLFTTTIPFLRYLAISLTGYEGVWGEAPWNEFGAFYHISGFVGYLVLGHYFRAHVKEMSWKKTLAIALPLWLVGYAIIMSWFYFQCPKEFPVSGPLSIAVEMERSWCFCTSGVALTTIAYFLIIRKFTASGRFYDKVILPISKVSYGMYLMHIFYLMLFFGPICSLGLGTGLSMLLTGVATYFASAATAKVITLIPGGKYIIG